MDKIRRIVYPKLKPFPFSVYREVCLIEGSVTKESTVFTCTIVVKYPQLKSNT